MFDNVYVKETLEERQNVILGGMMQLKQLQSRREKKYSLSWIVPMSFTSIIVVVCYY